MNSSKKSGRNIFSLVFTVSLIFLIAAVMIPGVMGATTVDLGTAGNYAILAKTGISTTGTTMINGNIGVSPAGGTSITGFGLVMDPTNRSSTSSLVAGTVYAADYANPTPATMTIAVSDMESAYTNAAGRAPDVTELGAGNIGGMTIAPGVYKWGTGVIIPTDVTLSGGPNDVWIFQIAQTLDISSGQHIILSGGAQAKNIFWQVAGKTSLGTGSVFYGTILDQTAIVEKTGATLNGRALAQTAVTLDANTVSLPTANMAAPRNGGSATSVDLGTAGNFVVLAKSAITTTGTTMINGNIGVSPASATSMTGFGLVMDASNQYSTSSLVTGKVYAADYTPPTPATMTAAVSDMETAYTNAAGRIPDVTELGAGNIGGMTIAPGVYKWSSGVTIPTDVTLSGGPNDVWIFQIAQTLDISSGQHIILSGGAQPKNVYWVVAGKTTLETGSVFYGTILDQTAIVLNTGATLNGRALAQSAVTLDTNALTSPMMMAAPRNGGSATTVNLRSAGNFAILAKSGIATTGTTMINGNIGVSPAAATYMTGFGLVMDPSNQYSKSSLVNGNVYASDYVPPTPATMSTAVSDMETAYTDGAGRAPDVTELGAGNIGGMTIAPGVYKWSTGVTIPTDVTLSGGPNDVWIFEIAQTLDISSGQHVILSGGAQAKNVYWVVAGQTTLGTGSVFNGNVLDQTAIVLKTGATLNGRALAQSAVTLDANTVNSPAAGMAAPANSGTATSVNLRSAGNYAILAKSGISTTGTTMINGNIGVSPAAATYMTGFGLVMDPSNQFSKSSLVTGNVYAADYVPPTPATMSTAVSDMETAYTDGTGRAPDVTELGAGNIGGMTIAPGVYKWGTGVTIPTDVTLYGGPNDVWIFEVAQTLDISSGQHVILSGGAQAKNVYWVVAGQTTLGTGSVFNGNVLDQTAIVLKTGATLNGRALAQSAVTLDANNVNSPAVGMAAPANSGSATSVNLGSAGNYAILAKSGISTTGTTMINGNIGVSPAAASYITGFGLVADASNQFSTSSLVAGKVYAADYTDPTPATLTTAVSDMEAAYTDGAGRAPDVTELGAGNIGGMTIAPGVYKWGTGVTIPTDVTLSGGPNDVWIFQIAQALDVSSGTHVILSGGAQAQNVYWVVAGPTTLGTGSVFNGNVLDQTAIVQMTGATLNGRALAQTAVTLDANNVNSPAAGMAAPANSGPVGIVGQISLAFQHLFGR